MIVFDLQCADGHRFEGWFGSSGDFERQQQTRLIACPRCASTVVGKAVMAPSVGRKGNQMPVRAQTERAVPSVTSSAGDTTTGKAVAMAKPHPANALPPDALKMMQALATMQAKALGESRWVGERFAEDARAMHYGERETETIHGRATLKETEQLIEEGIAVMPLPFPVVPPEQAN